MKRRAFIAQSAVATTALLTLPSCSFNAAPKYKMGLQLFTIRDAMEKDPIATLKAVKAMGYQDFEIYGFDPIKETIYGYKCPELKTILEDLNLTISSGHFGFSSYLNKPIAELKQYVDQCIKAAHSLNMAYITWPWLAPEQRGIETYKQLAPKLNIIGQQIKDAGLGFAYHNHGFDFTDHNGENGYDIILKNTDADLVKLQMDIYWVMHSATFTPKELVAQHPGRVVMWHIKDMDKLSRDYTELGNGSIDYTSILPDPKSSGLEYYYIEQGGNFKIDSMQSVAESALYFKKNLKGFL